jgi:hypothetical protein
MTQAMFTNTILLIGSEVALGIWQASIQVGQCRCRKQLQKSHKIGMLIYGECNKTSLQACDSYAEKYQRRFFSFFCPSRNMFGNVLKDLSEKEDLKPSEISDM